MQLPTNAKITIITYNRGVQCVDRDLPVDLKSTVGSSHDINTMADAIQYKTSE